MSQVDQPVGSLRSLRHDLKSPLNAIIGYCELMIEDCRDKEPDDYVSGLHNCIQAGKDLLETISIALNPSRSEYRNQTEHIEILNKEIDFKIRTSLNAILGYAELMLEKAKGEGRADLIPDLNHILDAAEQFQNSLEEFHTFELSRMDEFPENSVPSSPMNSLFPSSDTPQQSEVRRDSDRLSVGNILVVDDNIMNQDTLSRYLIKLGHQVSVAVNGQLAIDMVKKGHFDLILLDILMPVMNGYQVLGELKSEPEWHDIPIIMISALDEIDSVVQCIKLGAEDYLPKPFNPILLNARICASLDKKRLRDQEINYLKKVSKITSAAGAVEEGKYQFDYLQDIAAGEDGLAQLARVFRSMANEVYNREQNLLKQVQLLRIELDEARQAKQVAEITESEYFQELQAKAQELRHILDNP